MTPTKFEPMFPCYSVLNEDCDSPILCEVEGGEAMVVLTDTDLLERFRKSEEAIGPTIRFENAGQLALFLDMMGSKFETAFIAFDPSVAGKATTVTLKELARHLLK